MRRLVITLCAALTVWLPASVSSAQSRPTEPSRVAPGDEIKLDESGALSAAAILANFAPQQRQAQDLQQEMTKALGERKRLLEDAGKRVRIDVREPNEWVYDEAGQRYVRSPKKP